MKLKSFVLIALTTIGISSFSLSLLEQTSHAHPEESELSARDLPTDQVSFYCGEITDKNTGESIPATVAFVPQRQAEVAIIGWTKQWAGWNPKLRCNVVSPKFQAFYQNGRLNYLSNGINAGYDIICALLNEDEQCNGDNQLFQVRPGSKPEDVVLGLKGILRGEESSEVLLQSGEQQFYISIDEFLENAPEIKK